ncbi:hypothetical protein JOF56_008202 [Kibdelosporangium banguiense]|uniref:Peptidase inhibitor family I36 n=1 Tax=Kibdelosporangium banguiense TaxID=1365924 RepID=A0ABS4TTT8_9PSEU|nr:peptidase inhibitor family I36 protein [Kibdelosporangium banguiense]MBP2327817.1 hypothetical protein [Kibdelosporangium banguiense]
MRMKRLMAAVLMLLGSFVLAAGTASADSKPPAAVQVVATQVVAPAAWECSVGDFCAWTGLDGTGSRCAWTNADSDWLGGSVRCSWAGTSRVQSYWNRGTNTSFRGVKLYLSVNHNDLAYCAPQGTSWNVLDGGTFLRSHQWGNWVPNTCGP